MWKVIRWPRGRWVAIVMWYLGLAAFALLVLFSGDLRSHVSEVNWDRPPAHLKTVRTGMDFYYENRFGIPDTTRLEVSVDSKGLITEITFSMDSE